MKINIITGLYQRRSISTSGIFVYERLKILHSKKIPFEIWIIENHYSHFLMWLIKVLKLHLVDPTAIKWEISENQHIIPISVTLFKIISMYCFPNYYCKSIMKLLKREGCFSNDIFHAHWTFPTGYLAVQLSKHFRIPSIITAHGSDIHTHPVNNILIKRNTVKALTAADKVIFVSNALLNSALSLGYSGENATVIPNGIDSRDFFPMSKKDALKRTGWKQTHKYVVGFVGNLIQVKRADSFVYIFSEIQKRVSDVEFLIIGDGDLRENIKQGCKNCKIPVTFIGRVPHDNVGVWMNLFDVMLLPSRNEGWPCVVLEAYACGIPVIGSANGGIPEALGGLCPAVPDGDNFEIRFAEAVCDVLSKKITVDIDKLVSWALEHTWDNSVEKEIEIYYQLLDSNTL